ncbi:MAG: hypothetical protein Ct9H300mP15_24280 [Gemmatimonadota bacterium]|nr:MAG: hypothetical protein Ct9H300mP15_24280 [Gemmatimonadota bacterium]
MEHGFRKYARLLAMVFALPMIACDKGILIQLPSITSSPISTPKLQGVL